MQATLFNILPYGSYTSINPCNSADEAGQIGPILNWLQAFISLIPPCEDGQAKIGPDEHHEISDSKVPHQCDRETPSTLHLDQSMPNAAQSIESTSS